jgi:hypothetical protein
MNSSYAYRFDRYTSAFIDYKAACTKFHEAIFELSRNNILGYDDIDILSKNLTIKHAHFLECARRLVGAT